MVMLQGVFGSGVTFYLQSWSISVRGPLYSAMFNPLCTVITTVFAAAVLREELHVGRFVIVMHARFISYGDRAWSCESVTSIFCG